MTGSVLASRHSRIPVAGGRRRFRYRGAAVAAVLALAIATIASTATAKMELTAVGYAPRTHVMHRSLADYVELVSKATNGEVTMAFHPTGSLVGARDMLKAGRSGTADVVSLATSAFPAEFKFTGDAGTLLFLWDLGNFDKVIDILRPDFDKELEAQNLKLLWVVGTVTQWFMKRPTDLDKPDWSGRKVRGFGAISVQVIQALGGTSVTVANNEIPTAVSTGLLDGLGTSLGSFAAFDMYQQMPCMLLTNDVPLIPLIAINRDSWNKIPSAQQRVMTDQAKAIEARYIQELRTEEAAVQTQAKAKTNCVQEFTASQRAAWRTKLTPLYDDFKTKHGQQAEAFLNSVRSRLGQ